MREKLDFVEAGQILFRMDPLLAELDVEQAEAALTRAESQLALALANLGRQNSLAGNSVASESARDEAVNNEKVARATLRESRVALVRARDRLAKKTLAAPFAGELISFPVKVGEYVRPGERVGELLEVEHLRITIGLADHEIVLVVPGAAARLAVEARPGEVFEGTVLRAGGAVDSASRKFPVQVEIANPEGRLLPGMVARVGIDLGPPVELTSIPREAVLREFGVPFVYVLKPMAETGGWQAERRRVEVKDIPFWPIRLEVTSGLQPGERIALSSLRQLRDGAAVDPQTEAAEQPRPRVASRVDETVVAPAPDRAAGREGEGG
jgi:membrane fusion protein (multidrug efflux system)